jgi:hypothetical protein
MDQLNHFLNKIYHLINSSEKIKEQIQGVYLSINPNPAYPFIFINITKIDAANNNVKYEYEAEIEISIFYRDKDAPKYLKIADIINKELDIENFISAEYKVLGLKKQYFSFTKSQDAITGKLTINYLGRIREK